jgi:hypothetical protein
LPELVLKCHLAMMFLLPGDVIAHRLHLRKANGENPVTALPGKSLVINEFVSLMPFSIP